jgi:pimeloyl-ACP methyl ester carboxylesterase
MYYSIACNEEVPFTLPAIVAAANVTVRDEIKTVGLSYVTQLTLDICAFWGSPPPAANENDPVVSDIPALVFAGEYDPITRPQYGELVASHLSHSSFLEFPGTGHGVLGAGCATDIVTQFLANPTQPVDGSCVTTIPPPAFIVVP